MSRAEDADLRRKHWTWRNLKERAISRLVNAVQRSRRSRDNQEAFESETQSVCPIASFTLLFCYSFLFSFSFLIQNFFPVLDFITSGSIWCRRRTHKKHHTIKKSLQKLKRRRRKKTSCILFFLEIWNSVLLIGCCCNKMMLAHWLFLLSRDISESTAVLSLPVSQSAAI